jgi:hypothetical protein
MSVLTTYSTYQPTYRHDQQFVHGNPIPALCPPEFVLDHYLAGLPLTASIGGQDLRGLVQQKIDASVGEFEQRLNMFLVPRVIIACAMNYTPQIIESVSGTNANGYGITGQAAQPGVDYDLLEVPYDYTSRRFERWSLIKARHRPILAVANVVYALPPNFGILIVPKPWISADPNSGIVRIVPVEGAMAVTSPGAGMWLPFFTMGQMNHVPQFTQMTYTAGILPIPDDMIDALAMLAAAKTLQVYNRAYYPGAQSFTHAVDGFNQTIQLRPRGPFADDIAALTQQALAYIALYRESHNGLRMESLGR